MTRNRLAMCVALGAMGLGLLTPLESSAGLFKRRACKPKCCAAPAPAVATTTPCGTMAPAGMTPVPATAPVYESPPAPTPPEETGSGK